MSQWLKRISGMLLISILLLKVAMSYIAQRPQPILVEPETFLARTFDLNGEERTMKTLIDALDHLQYIKFSDSEYVTAYAAMLTSDSEKAITSFLLDPASILEIVKDVERTKTTYVIDYDEVSGLRIKLTLVNGKLTNKVGADYTCPEVTIVYCYDYEKDVFSVVRS